MPRKTTYLRHNSIGFTLVELLIVIVVIAILAAITVVAFNGVQTRATISVVEDGLAQASRAIELDKVVRGEYTEGLSSLEASGISDNQSDIIYQYTKTSEGGQDGYCLSASLRSISRYTSSANASNINEGVCSGHSLPAGDSNVSIAASQSGVFDGLRSETFTISVPGTVETGDLVFIVFNHDAVNTLNNVSLNGTAMTNVYAKKSISGRPTTGRQAMAAYSAPVSSSASAQITIAGTGASPGAWTAAYGRYMIYVIRGAVSSDISYQDTAFGDIAVGSSLQTASQVLPKGGLAIMSYLYYSFAGNPNLVDSSTPGLTWQVDSARSGASAMSFPGASGNSLSAYHAIASEETNVSYRIDMPTSGTSSYQGAGLTVFTIK